jgi:predicted nucleic acid-binding protein
MQTLIVAGSSFIVEGLLKKWELLADEQIVAPELVACEVTNAIWKHEHLLKDVENGEQYVSFFYGLIDAGKIKILTQMKS